MKRRITDCIVKSLRVREKIKNQQKLPYATVIIGEKQTPKHKQIS